MIHVPRYLPYAPDALSYCPDLLLATNLDNDSVTLLPKSLYVNLINVQLSSKLAASSSTNPVVLTALQALSGEVFPTIHSHLSDWCFDTGILTYQCHIYIPNNLDLCHSVVAQHHDHLSAGHPGYLKSHQLVATEY